LFTAAKTGLTPDVSHVILMLYISNKKEPS